MMVVCQTTSVRLFVIHEQRVVEQRVVELRFESRKARAEARKVYERNGFTCSTSKVRLKRQH